MFERIRLCGVVSSELAIVEIHVCAEIHIAYVCAPREVSRTYSVECNGNFDLRIEDEFAKPCNISVLSRTGGFKASNAM